MWKRKQGEVLKVTLHQIQMLIILGPFLLTTPEVFAYVLQLIGWSRTVLNLLLGGDLISILSIHRYCGLYVFFPSLISVRLLDASSFRPRIIYTSVLTLVVLELCSYISVLTLLLLHFCYYISVLTLLLLHFCSYTSVLLSYTHLLSYQFVFLHLQSITTTTLHLFTSVKSPSWPKHIKVFAAVLRV